MLKIREDIPLEELEKYGFEYKNEDEIEGKLEYWELEYWEYVDKYVPYRKIYIPVWSREVVCLGGCDIVYDLIQAGIVVKE